MPRTKQPTPVKAEEGIFLTVGIPHGEAGRRALIRLGEITSRHGYRIGVSSDEAILARAEQIREEQKAAASAAAAQDTDTEGTEES